MCWHRVGIRALPCRRHSTIRSGQLRSECCSPSLEYPVETVEGRVEFNICSAAAVKFHFHMPDDEAAGGVGEEGD
jgi:hypothetical protein